MVDTIPIVADHVYKVLVEPVSFTFDTINLGSIIVCGLPALPHDLVHKSDARCCLLRVPR